VGGEREADPEVCLAAAGLPPIQSFVCKTEICVRLRPRQGKPYRILCLPGRLRVLPRNLAQERLELRARAFDLAQQVVEERQGF